MSTEELKDEIKKCDISRPYLFISYSGKDAAYVFEDVVEFQKRKVNVWIDERGVDHTQASWKDSALRAIEDIDCRLVLFYVSENSLMSRACLEELRKTCSEETMELHAMQRVKYICIDVFEPDAEKQDKEQKAADVRSILDLIGDCWEQNLGNYDSLDKEKRIEQMRTVSCFYKEIFGGTNERVRIPARKGVPEEDKNYYTKLSRYFPDSVYMHDEISEDEYMLETDRNDPVFLHSIGLHFYHEAMKKGDKKDKTVEEYKKKSFEYYRRSAEMGFAKAENKVGLCYRDGNGAAADPAEAFKWFTKAAEHGDDMGQYNLGECFEFGRGTEKNMDMAVWWYKMAAAQGNSRSIYRLQELKRKEGADEVQD